MKKYQIWQPNTETEQGRALQFISYRRVRKLNYEISENTYKKVYEGEIEEDDPSDTLMTLESLFQKFNINRPSDFRGHSLSVADIIILDDIAYYTDDIGFKEIDFPHQDKKKEKKVDFEAFIKREKEIYYGTV